MFKIFSRINNVLFLTGLIGLSVSFGQGNSGSVWYFGTSGNGVEFNLGNSTPSGTSGNVGLGSGGSAVAVDPMTGNLLFYTDGQNVYDANHQYMPNGTGLNGDPSSNQPVVVCAVPGTTDQYYVFTNSASAGSAGAISYSIVDMSQFGNATFPSPAAGDVTSKNQSINALLSNTSQAMMVVPNDSTDGFWLIVHEFGTDRYHVVEIDASGFVGITTYGGLGLPIEAANFSYHAGTNKLAVSPDNAYNDVMIFDFDPSTGALSFYATVVNTGGATTNSESIYDTEWSADGNYLYVSIIGDNGITADVVQYDVQNPSTTLASVLPGSIYRSYGLQIGPDGNIYHLYQQSSGGPILLGKISNADSVATKVIYEVSPFGVANYNGKQFSASLPAYNQNISVDFEVIGTCANSPSLFTPIIDPGADSVLWDFGDGGTSREFGPVYTYTTGGAMPVTLTAYLNGIGTDTTKVVNITQFDLQINVTSDTVGCTCEFPVNSSLPECAGATQFMNITATIQGGTPTSIVWSNGQTGTTLAPDSAGFYYVVVTDASGCSAYAGVTVREYGEIDARANVWYFGQNAGINFNTFPDPALALGDGALNAPEGSSAISNRNGEIVLYTDGSTVYDKNHAVIATNIGGDPGSAQSALIVPFPGDETLYYIFTTQEVDGSGVYEVRYSIFDVKENNGDGGIIAQNILLHSSSTERIVSMGDWIIIHEYGNSTFKAYPLTANGLGQPVVSDIGSVHDYSTLANGQGTMKFSSTGKLAVTLSDPGNYNYVELFDFDSATGELTNFIQVDLGETTGQVYGVDFSPGGNKLYATINGDQSMLVEYFIDSIGQPYLKQKISATKQLGGIQIGPDGQLYVAVDGSNYLGVIYPAEDTTLLSTFIEDGFQLAAGTSSTLGLPAFTQSLATGPQSPGILAGGLCFGEETQFEAQGTDIIDTYTWFFGDGASATGQQVLHTYGAPGDYLVALQLQNRCGLDTTLTRTITIYDVPPPPTIPASDVLCSGPLTLQAADPADPNFADYSFFWSTGETTNTIQVNEQSIVSVLIVNPAGCSSTAQTLIAENRPLADLGPDQTVCQDQFVLGLDAGNAGATYAWTINGAAAGTSQTMAVDTSVPGTYLYEVTITDPLTLCTYVEDKAITVKAIPVYIVTPTNSPGCNNNDGSININITTTGSYSYYISGAVFRNGIDQVGPISTINETGLPVGTYFVTILDEVSNCAVTQVVDILDQGSTMIIPTPTSNPGCTNVSVHVDLTNGTFNGTMGFNYTLTNLDNTTITTGSSPTEPFDSELVIPGNYTLLIEDIATTCTSLVGPFVVTESPAATLTMATPDLCVTPVVVTTTTNATTPVYSWTGPAGFSSTAASINAPQTGYYYATVNDASLAKCPTTDSLFVFVNSFDPLIEIIGDRCSGQILLNVTPDVGNYSYVWTGPKSGGQQLIVTPPESGRYSVTVRDRDTGCTKTSSEINVSVIDSVSVALTTTLACDDGNPFTLTANASPGVVYTWFKDGAIIPDSTSNTLSSLTGGTFTVEVNNEGCKAVDDIMVRLAPFTFPDLPNRVSICDDPDNPDPSTSEVTLDVGSIFVNFIWKRDGTIVGTDQQYTATRAGNYTVDLLNAYGCPAADTVEVVTECNPYLGIPNAFSPNGNSQNEEFFIFTTFVSDDFEIKIFNRWGEIVFVSDDKKFRWNGTYNNTGKEIPGGMYVYVIRYISEYQPERGFQETRGGVMLLK